MLLIPLLPEGSTYVGVDFSKTMIEAAEAIFSKQGIRAQFVNSDSQLYKQAGNGITVNVLYDIAKKLN